jgi:hypothetical protein
MNVIFSNDTMPPLLMVKLSECYYPLKLQYDGILEGKDMVVLWRARGKLQILMHNP